MLFVPQTLSYYQNTRNGEKICVCKIYIVNKNVVVALIESGPQIKFDKKNVIESYGIVLSNDRALQAYSPRQATGVRKKVLQKLKM